MNLVNIFLDPGKVFASQKDKPLPWMPMLLMVIATAALFLTYFQRVDADWLNGQMLAQLGQEMTATELEQVKATMPGAKTLGYISAVSAAIMIPVVLLIMAVYYLLAAKVLGRNLGFMHGWALGAWGGFPAVLGMLVGLVGALTMAPQTAQESLMLTHIDPLFVQLPRDHALSGFAKGFDLLVIWSIGLTAFGWRTMTGARWAESIAVAIMPSVVIYGVWLVIALT